MTDTTTAGESQGTETTDSKFTDNSPPEIKERATKLGWIDPADWRGDPPPHGFETAEEFIARPSMKRVDERLTTIERDFNDRLSRAERAANAALDRQRAQHEAELANIRAVKDDAGKKGDKKTYEAAKAREEIIEKQSVEQQQALTDEEYRRKESAWRAANPWYDADETLQVLANGMSEKIGKANPSWSFEEVQAAVVERVKKTFPAKFMPAGANGHAPDSGGLGLRRSKTKSYDDLPPEAKAACDGFVKKKLMTQEDYVKEYFKENANG